MGGSASTLVLLPAPSLIRTPAWPAEAGNIFVQGIDPAGELFKLSQNLLVTLNRHGAVHWDAAECFELVT